MRVAVIVAWRPKQFPDWDGRASPAGARVPAALAYDRGAAPYVGVHLASILPRHWDIVLIHEMLRDVDPATLDVDAAFISTMDFCAPHARRVARRFRARGVKVIVGGLYPTLNPGYFAGAADAVVVGEADVVLPRLVADLERGRLADTYIADAPADLDALPVPRWDLVETEFTATMGYEATRGCPFACSFCVLSAIRDPYRRRPIPHVIRDISAVPPGWNWLQRKFITFWDNNIGADRQYFRELCAALAPLKRFWAAETSFDTLTPESARQMGKAGCRWVYVGLESLAPESLTASNKRQNKVREYRTRIGYLHDNGMVVMSIFLVGLDGDTPEYLKKLPDLVDEIGVDVPIYSLAVPIEATAFRRELAAEGRLLPGDLLDGSDGAHLVYRPKHVSPDELELALSDCMLRSYHPCRVARRMLRRVPNGYSCALTNFGANRCYMRYQRAVARAGRARLGKRGPWPGPASAAVELS